MRFIKRLPGLGFSLLRLAAHRAVADGPALLLATPSRVRTTVGIGRTRAAPLWRKAIRLTVAAVGLGIYLYLQYVLAGLINTENWYQIGAAIVAIGSVTLVIARPPLAFAMWIVLSPYVALFFREAIAGKILVSFDRIALAGLCAVLLARSLLQRFPFRKLMAAEWLLFASFVYGYVVPSVGRLGTIIHTTNIVLGWMLTPFVIYSVCRACIRNKRHVIWILLAFYIMGLLWSVSGFYEHFTGKKWLSPITEAGWGVEVGLRRHDVAKGRAAGPTEHYYTYGEVLALAMLLAFHFASWTKRSDVKWFCYLSMGFMAVGLYYGYSRAPYIAFAAAILIMPLLATVKRKQYAGLALVFVVAVAAATPTVLASPQLARRILGGGSMEAREIMTATGINVIKDYFWFGTGVNKMTDLLPRYVSSTRHGRSAGGQYYKPHNEYIVILAEQGIFGFIFFFGSIYGLTRHCFKVRARLPSAGVLGKNLAATIIVFSMMHAIAMMFDEFQGIQYSYYVLFTLFAVGVRVGELQEGESQPEAAEASATPLPRQVAAAGA